LKSRNDTDHITDIIKDGSLNGRVVMVRDRLAEIEADPDRKKAAGQIIPAEKPYRTGDQV
jgi:hypothetical protein